MRDALRTTATRRKFLGRAVLMGMTLGVTKTQPVACSGLVTLGPEHLAVDADFPGGNIIVERIEGSDIFLRQDLRDTEGWWFYWYFRVRHAAGKMLRLHFTNKDVFTCRGPAAKIGDGPWCWLGRQCIQNTSFVFEVPKDVDEVRFCLAVPYLEQELRQFVSRYESTPAIRVEPHCQTKKGRTVERLHLGCLVKEPGHRVLLTCRHHACEMMASWVLEGFMEAVLTGPDAEWFANQVEVVAIPFMDKDGVEDGDQGKNRRPHDHNRDYTDRPIYESVRALMDFVPGWSQGKLHLALDLHCPYIRGRRDEQIFLVGSPNPAIQREIDRFSEILAKFAQAPLPYRPENNIPFGVEWNNQAEAATFARWASRLQGVQLACTLEFPYACAGGGVVEPATARTFGGQLAVAVRQYLETL